MSIYEKAIELLRKYNGTDTEGLYILNSLNGNPILNRKGTENGLGVQLSKKDLYIIKTYKGIVGIHNHPTNLLPNGSDFVAAGSRKYDFGVVVTHSGRVIKYEAGNKPFYPIVLDNRVKFLSVNKK